MRFPLLPEEYAAAAETALARSLARLEGIVARLPEEDRWVADDTLDRVESALENSRQRLEALEDDL